MKHPRVEAITERMGIMVDASKASQPNNTLIKIVKENPKTYSFILYRNFIDFPLCSVFFR